MNIGGAFHPEPRGPREVQPFVVAPYGDMQDRVLFGPASVTTDQSSFFGWLYRDLALRSHVTCFRLGWHAGFAVAARIHSVDVPETISNRRDGISVIGLMARKASPAALCECLGVLGPIVASRSIGGGYPGEEAVEAVLYTDLARFVADTPRDYDWTVAALESRRECAGVPLFRLNGRYRLRKWLARRRTFGALVSASAPLSLKYQMVSELWLHSRCPDMTIVVDVEEECPDSHHLYFESGFHPAGPLLVLNLRKVSLQRHSVMLEAEPPL